MKRFPLGMPGFRRKFGRRCAVVGGALLAAPAISAAQVVLDGSLGPAGPRVGPNYLVPASVGRLAGTNLFHSFAQLNVNQGESLTFTAPSDVPVGNVLARVTGGQASTINGLLRSSIPGANLYLVNPSGVVFGPEAQLDVGGSFVVTTADRLRLADGARFNAAPNAEADALLTTASPAAFGFLSTKPAPVTYDGGGSTAGLTVPDGAVLSIVGGDVRITAGTLRSVSGRVNVVAVASAGEVGFDPTAAAQGPLTLPQPFAGGKIELLDRSRIGVEEGGAAVLRGGELTVNRSEIAAVNQDQPGGAIDIDTSPDGPVNLLNARIDSRARGAAPGGNVSVAGGAVVIRGLSDNAENAISTNAEDTGAGGRVSVTGRTVELSQGGAIISFTKSSAPGGVIDVSAREAIRIDGTGAAFITGVFAETLDASDGPAGNITLDAPLVEMVREGELTSTTRGIGRAGDITVRADTFRVDGGNAPTLTGIQSRVGDLDGIGATGGGGDVAVGPRAPGGGLSLQLLNGGVISASTFGRGPGGNIAIDAADVTLAGSDPNVFTGVFARSTLPTRGGRGGDVVVNARSLAVTGPAQISALSTGSGTAGNVSVNVTDSVTLSRGGSVTVQAVYADDPADEIPPVTPAPLADAGGIEIIAGRNISLLDGGVVSARATQDSGRIKLTAPGRVQVVGSTITAEAGRDAGVNGEISIDPDAVILDRSTINGLAGGRDVPVTIVADVFLTSQSQILTDTAVLPPEVDIAGSLVRLNAGLADDAAQLAEICGLRAAGAVSSFVATGRGGSPLTPGGFEPALEIRDGAPTAQER